MGVVVLGGVGVTLEDAAFRSLPGQQAAVLSALVAAAPDPVSDDELVDTLWRDRPPKSAQNGLRVVVNRLRARLADAGLTEAIVTEPIGYRLSVGRDDVDYLAFVDIVSDARELLRSGEVVTARSRLEDGLHLWRGAAFHPFEGGTDRIRIAAAHAEGLRSAAEELIVEALLGEGDEDRAASLATALVGAAPLRERRWELLMLALYRAGRQAEALRAFDRARHRLREELGLDPGPDLQALHRDILEHRVPIPERAPQRVRALVPPPAIGPILPVPATSFHGREDSLKALRKSLETSRLVTVVGPGGAGKTRLVTEFVAARGDAVVDWVDLAALDRESTTAAIADRWEVPDDDGVVASIVRVLHDREGFFVLDNCEHVLEPVARLAEAIVRGCPRLRVLATSRVPLATESETRLVLGPLDENTAIDLVLERAFGPNDRPSFEERDLLRLVQQVDAMPLHIELVAGLLRSREPTDLAEGLSNSIRPLVAPRRSEPRHRALSQTIEWSLGLLDDELASIFDSLAVFVGPFGREEAEQMLSRPLDAALGSLVDASLLNVTGGGRQRRFQMLETMRVHARSRLEAAGRLDELRRRHAGSFAALAVRSGRDYTGADEESVVERFRANLDQFRAAFRFSAAEADVDAMAQLATGVQYFAAGHRLHREVAWALEVVEHPDAAALADRVGALTSAAYAAWYAGDLERAEAFAAEASSQATAEGTAPPAIAAQVEFRVAAHRRDFEAAADALVRWAGLAVSSGDVVQIFESTVSAATGSVYFEAYDAADEYAGQALVLARERANATALAVAHWSVAFARYGRAAADGTGAVDEILRDFLEAQRLASSVGNAVVMGWCSDMVIACLRRLDRLDEARGWLLTAFERWQHRPVNTHLGLNQAMKELVMVLAAGGRPEDAARIARVRRDLPIDSPLVPGDERLIDVVERGLAIDAVPTLFGEPIEEALRCLSRP